MRLILATKSHVERGEEMVDEQWAFLENEDALAVNQCVIDCEHAGFEVVVFGIGDGNWPAGLPVGQRMEVEG